METWKVVDWLDGYGGVLSVSDHGRVKRNGYRYKSTGRWGREFEGSKPDKVLSCSLERGYPTAAVLIDGKRRRFGVHHLVARAFVPGYEQGLVVNHIDGVKTNNLPANLEWVTQSRNSQHAWETGLVDLRGDAHPSRKLSSGQVRIIRDLLKLGATPNQLSVLIGVSSSLLHLIAKGERWNSV
jgi:hypothetical protein